MATRREPAAGQGQAPSAGPGQALGQALRRLLRRKGPAPRVEVAPGSAFEAVLAQRIASLEQRLDELRGRLNGLIFLVLGAVLVQMVLRVAGL